MTYQWNDDHPDRSLFHVFFKTIASRGGCASHWMTQRIVNGKGLGLTLPSMTGKKKKGPV